MLRFLRLFSLAPLITMFSDMGYSVYRFNTLQFLEIKY
jgi:hypothetical protein